jgi:hypothetical protein
MPPHTVSIELRTTCDGCARPLPVNRLTPRVRCLACRADNPIVPESWDVLLHDALVADPDDAPATVALRHAGRAYQVRFAPGATASGESRARPDDLPDGILVGLSAIIGEDPPDEARPETGPIPFVCPQCAGALTVDGKVRIVHSGFCGADTLLSDAVWARLHPSDGVRAWYLRIDGVQGAPEPLVWSGDAVAGPDGDVYVVTGPKAGVARVRLPDRARWKRADLPLRDPEEVRLVVDPSGDVWVAGPGGATHRRALGRRCSPGARTHPRARYHPRRQKRNRDIRIRNRVREQGRRIKTVRRIIPCCRSSDIRSADDT